MDTAQPSFPSVGWIGTGRMGFSLVKRLLDSGISVHVWNRTRAKAEQLVSYGAVVVDTPADLADRNVVFSMVSDSGAFISTMLGSDGLLSANDRCPEVICDSSTISIEASERVRKAAIDRPTQLICAPVSGNHNKVESGELGVIVSGELSAYQMAKPVLERFGNSLTYLGEGEIARLAKICHNLLLAILAQGLAEVTVLAERNGMTRSQFLAVVNNSIVGSPLTQYKAPQLIELDWTPTFTVHQLRKDLELGLEVAQATDVPLPLVADTHQLALRLIGDGQGDDDFCALLELAARGAGMQLASEGSQGDR